MHLHIVYMIMMVCFCFSFLSSVQNEIRIETYQESEIAPYAHELSSLCRKIFKDYPYFYDNDNDYEEYLLSYPYKKGSIVCAAFDGEKMVGVAAGVPMMNAGDFYQSAFLEKEEDLNKFFYLGELVLLPEYRGQGLGREMFQRIEPIVKKNTEFSLICLIQIDESMVQGLKPEGDASAYSFWEKSGFEQRPELNYLGYWINTNETEESPHMMVFWTKNL